MCGTDEQKADVVPRILAGEVMCCLGYSEPDAGSDVAAVATKAVRDGDHWVIDGQKMFTTMAHEAHYVFLLARSNPEAPKHKGLTMFLVPMDTPGHRDHAGRDHGRRAHQHHLLQRGPGARLGPGRRRRRRLVGDARRPRLRAQLGQLGRAEPPGGVRGRLGRSSPDPTARRPFDDPAVRATLARATTELEVGRLLLFRTAWLSSLGEMPQVEGSMAKLHITEAFVRASSELLHLLGPAGLLPGGEPAAVLGGLVEHAFRHAVVTTIYGGSSEVQREIIAGPGPRASPESLTSRPRI